MRDKEGWVTNILLPRSATSPASHIFFVDCLRPTDMQTSTGRRNVALDTLMAVSLETIDKDKKAILHFPSHNLQELKSSFNKIQDFCKFEADPLIFIDGHGDKFRGIELRSWEFMSWLDLIYHLNFITKLARGNLTVVAALCHSMVVEHMIPVEGLLPFSFYYGYKSKVAAKDVEIEGQQICESLLVDGGKSILENSKFKISCFSEFDHVNRVVLPLLLRKVSPEDLLENFPGLSKNKLKQALGPQLAQMGVPLSGLGNVVEEIINGKRIIEEIVKSLMHDTERRVQYLNAVISAHQSLTLRVKK